MFVLVLNLYVKSKKLPAKIRATGPTPKRQGNSDKSQQQAVSHADECVALQPASHFHVICISMASKFSVPHMNGVCLLDICADQTRVSQFTPG